jgi:hypothetical protein
MTRATALISAAALALAIPSAAWAKPARCFTTDDGYFNCDFRMTDKLGSFEIKSKGKPGFSLVIEAPGIGSGYLRIDGRSIPVNGAYERQSDDPACWRNAEQQVKVCAW